MAADATLPFDAALDIESLTSSSSNSFRSTSHLV